MAANAQTRTWTSTASGSGDWSDADNWSDDIAPSPGDSLIFAIPTGGGTRVTNNDFAANTLFGDITIQANTTQLNGNAINLGGNIAFTAGGANTAFVNLGLQLQQAAVISVAANTSNGRLEIGGGISGDYGIEKTGDGRLRFVGTPKSYNGDTIVSGGILDLVGADNLLPYGAGKGSVFIASGAQLLINNQNTNINGLSGSGTLTKSGSNTRTITIGNGDASENFAGDISMSGGSSSLNKVGAGTQILGGNVTTAGAGTVSGGTLRIDGSWSNGLTVNNGATLEGNGTIGGTATVASGGILSPGASIGSLGVGSVSLNGTLEIEYDGAAIDLLNVTGNLNISSAAVNFFQLGESLTEESYIFATYGSLTGTEFANVSNLPEGYQIDYAFGGSNSIALVLIPEPATTLLGALGMLGLLRRRR